MRNRGDLHQLLPLDWLGELGSGGPGGSIGAVSSLRENCQSDGEDHGDRWNRPADFLSMLLPPRVSTIFSPSSALHVELLGERGEDILVGRVHFLGFEGAVGVRGRGNGRRGTWGRRIVSGQRGR